MYLATSQDGQNKSYQLVTGDSTFCAMIIGYALPNDSVSLAEIKSMMLSYVYLKKHTINYEEIAPFAYNQDTSYFKYARASSNMYTYSIDGEKKESYEGEPFIVVTWFAKLDLSPKAISLKMIKQHQLNGNELLLVRGSFAKINGYRAYEGLYNGTRGDKKSIYYSLVLVNDEFAIVVTGSALGDDKKAISEMIKFGHSLTIK